MSSYARDGLEGDHKEFSDKLNNRNVKFDSRSKLWWRYYSKM